MDLHIVVILLFYGAVMGAKELHTGGEANIFPVSSEILDDKQPSKVLALVVVEDIDEPEEINQSLKHKTPMLPWIENPEIMLPWIEGKLKHNEVDSSGESNSDEYPDSDTDSYDSDSESNYYHEDDYIKEELKKELVALKNEKNDLVGMLRNRWKSCQKKAAKYCRKACVAAYKNACSAYDCNRKLKKTLKKECKQNCVDYFT